jgi:hypothetical protein
MIGMKMKEFAVGILILFVSCTSTPKGPIDIGVFNAENLPEEELATLIIHSHIKVQQIDDNKVNWSGDNNRRINQMVKIPSGLHTFQVIFHDGRKYTLVPMPVGALFERGNTYLLSSTEVEREVTIFGHTTTQKQADFHIHLYNEGIKGEEVSLNPNSLQQNEMAAHFAYSNYVHYPISSEGKSILMVNDDYLLVYRPDNIYTLKNNKTGVTTEGRYIWPTGWRTVQGKVFLYEVDIKTMSRQEFMSTDNIRNYVENSQMILVPIKCTSNEVVYRCERPIELEGTEIRFIMTHISQ